MVIYKRSVCFNSAFFLSLSTCFLNFENLLLFVRYFTNQINRTIVNLIFLIISFGGKSIATLRFLLSY